jgi:hypothetical protein
LKQRKRSRRDALPWNPRGRPVAGSMCSRSSAMGLTTPVRSEGGPIEVTSLRAGASSRRARLHEVAETVRGCHGCVVSYVRVRGDNRTLQNEYIYMRVSRLHWIISRGSFWGKGRFLEMGKYIQPGECSHKSGGMKRITLTCFHGAVPSIQNVR